MVAGGSNVLLSRAADEWLTLLEALEQQRTNRVRAVALTSFVGESAASLDAGGDALADDVAERVRSWLDLFRTRGVAAVHEALRAANLPGRVLSQPEGERLLTDIDHIGQLLHETARRQRLGLPALLEWFREERRDALASTERTRRLDTDAAAVQILTIHGSKGLQYPVVYLPHFFDCYVPDASEQLFHDDEGTRRLDLAGSADAVRRARAEDAGEELRLTYVALTRAQSQVVTWWGPSQNAANSGLSRLLFGRSMGESTVPDRVAVPSDFEATAALAQWQEDGALALETAEVGTAVELPAPDAPGRLDARAFSRSIDTDWRRTSYSGLIRAEEQLVTTAVDAEPEVPGTVDEDAGRRGPAPGRVRRVGAAEADVASPMADLPAGATFGSLVHGVLEHTDPRAGDLLTELRRHVEEQRRWWPVEATTEALAEALVPMQHTSLGPLAERLTLADIGPRDRLCELDFEFPLVGGDRPAALAPVVALRAVADVLRSHLADDDPMRAYADRLESPSLGGQLLRGYLSGSIDVVLRVPDAHAGHRFLVVDYKTNRLGDPERPLTAADYTPARMTDAMLHEHYPLQALLYSVVLHRYLRWRLPGYEPARHLGGILYLYVRGMCGPSTPEVDGQPCGVFAWNPPAAMVVELSDLLAGLAGRPRGRTGGVDVNAETVPLVDGHDRRFALRAGGLLAQFNLADVLTAADVHVATRLGTMTGEDDEEVLLATALAVRAVRQGSTCLDLATVAERPLEDDPDTAALPWPDPEPWQAKVAASPVVVQQVLRLDNDLLYLDRYWREEVQVCRDLVERLDRLGAGGRCASPGCRRAAGVPQGRVRRAAHRSPWRRRALDHRADGRTRHRQDHHRRRAARAAGRAGRARRARGPTPADRAERPDRQGVGPPAGVRRPRDEGAAAGRPRAPGRAEGVDTSPAAGLAAGQQHPVPARPDQPAPARRRRGRRDLDGVADDDGPAARGGPSRHPAGAGRRPGSAGLRGGGRRARRPRRRLRPGSRPPRSSHW